MSIDSSATRPNPVFILQNSKPISSLSFSDYHQNLLFSGNRDGDLIVFNLELRRNIFTAKPNKHALLGLAELDENNLLSFSRNGSIFKWSMNSSTEFAYKCKIQVLKY